VNSKPQTRVGEGDAYRGRVQRVIDSGLVGRKVFFGEISRGEKMLYSWTDPGSYITEYALVYEDEHSRTQRFAGVDVSPSARGCRV